MMKFWSKNSHNRRQLLIHSVHLARANSVDRRGINSQPVSTGVTTQNITQ